MHMYYVYVLYSKKSDRLYTGYTIDLKQRVAEHNSGEGGAYTSKNRPFILVYYEAFLRKEDATKEEKFYKSGYGREVLNEKMKKSKEFAAMVQW
jgi:putative endonuclease